MDKKEVKRTVQVNDDISLEKFCQYVIVCMNGNCKHLYQLTVNEEYSYLGPGCNIISASDEEMIKDQKLQDLYLPEGTMLMVNYDFRCDWEFIIKIKSLKKGYFEKDFEVISGCGCGIAEDAYSLGILKKMIELKRENAEYCDRVYPEFKEYDINNFDIHTINEKIENYLEKYYEYVKPKNYLMNISLN